MALWYDDFTQRILPPSLSMPINSQAEAEAFYPNLVNFFHLLFQVGFDDLDRVNDFSNKD